MIIGEKVENDRTNEGRQRRSGATGNMKGRSMLRDQFNTLVTEISGAIAGRALDRSLADFLNATYPADGEAFGRLEKMCHDAIAEGWMCKHGDSGRRFGRVIKPGPETNAFSCDVVELIDIKGPHHIHPKGEICAVMPIDDTAKFDGNGKGWCVYPPKSGHWPTVSEGAALVLYLLPDGEIEFTGK